MGNRTLTNSVQILKESYNIHALRFNFNCSRQETYFLIDKPTLVHWWWTNTLQGQNSQIACFDRSGKQSEANPNQQTVRLHQGYKRSTKRCEKGYKSTQGIITKAIKTDRRCARLRQGHRRLKTDKSCVRLRQSHRRLKTECHACACVKVTEG